MRTMEALACVEPGRFERAKRPRPVGRPGNIRVRIAVLGEHTDGGMCARSWRPRGTFIPRTARHHRLRR